MLQEAQVNRHRFLFLVRYFGHACKEYRLTFLGIQLVAVLREIELERRVGDNEIELLEPARFLGESRLGEGVALYHVLQRCRQPVQNEIQAQQAAGLLGDILRKDSTLILPDAVGKAHQQRTRPCGRVVAGHALGFAVHQNLCHYAPHAVWGEVFGIFTAGISVVVLNQILVDAGVEVIALFKGIFKGELRKLVDDGSAEVGSLAGIGNENAERLEHQNGRMLRCTHGEDVGILRGHLGQGVIKQLVKAGLILTVVQAGDELLLLKRAILAGRIYSSSSNSSPSIAMMPS